MNCLPLLDNLYWIGVQDHDLEVFDIVMETKYGTSYNSYLLKDEKTVLFETVKVKYIESYLTKIEALTKIEDIDYIVVSHTEPDHAGSIEKLLALNPNITIIASAVAIRYLKNIVNVPFNAIAVKQDQTLSIGSKTLQFISAPNLHWPDTIYTYVLEDQTLFTCDSFGSHYAFDDVLLSKLPAAKEADYQDALLNYYVPIFSPFKSFVLKALEKISDLELKMVCTGHGPVLDTRIDEIFNTYQNWSTSEPKTEKLVVIPYTSAYGYTKIMAQTLQDTMLNTNPNLKIELYDLNVLNYETLKPQLLDRIAVADALLIGASTINKDAVPIIWDLLAHLSPIVHGGTLGAAFGSYGWSGEAPDYVHERLKQLRFKVEEPVKLCFMPTEEKLEETKALAVTIAQKIAE